MHRIPLLLLTAACLPLPPAELPACEHTRRDVALDEALGPYAYTAEDVLAFATGTWTMDEEGEEDDRTVEATAGWERDEGEELGLTVEVIHVGRAVVCEGEQEVPPGVTDMEEQFARLDLEVEIALSTSDGRFDQERARAFLSSEAGDWALGTYRLDPDAVDVPVSVPEGEDLEVQVWFEARGYVEGTVEPGVLYWSSPFHVGVW